MKNVGVSTVFHFVPLHSSSHGKIVARSHGDMLNTDELSNRLVRLPLWIGAIAGSGHLRYRQRTSGLSLPLTLGLFAWRKAEAKIV